VLTASAGPYIAGDDRRFLGELVRRLDWIESAWGALDEQVRGLPATLVHADFVAKNIRIHDDANAAISIVAFDWEMSGWGVPLRDLAVLDIGAYAASARPFWGRRSSDLGRLSEIGRVFSLLASIEWEMPGLLTAWPRRYLARLRVFHDRLGTAAARSRVASASPARTRPDGRVEAPGSDDMGDREHVARGLRSMEPHGRTRIVEVIDQAPNIYRSTSPSAIVRCAFDDGVVRSVFVKRDVPGLHSGGRFWAGGSYEADIYRDVLAGSSCGTPDYYGSWSEPAHGDSYLAVAYIDGWRLSRSEPAWLVEAARRLSRVHRDLTAAALRHPAVRQYDQAFYASCSHRALAALRKAGVGEGWRESLFRTFDHQMIPSLLASDRSFVHGEPYPQNVIVSAGQVWVVDWQSAAIGSGAIDLACLTSGRWPVELIAESERAYATERWGTGSAPASFSAELLAARIYWSMRWLGAQVDATTVAQRDRDVEGLRRSAEQLGLLSIKG
jgi:aminoglycoside phosphotransferase (APT) family kinase protein